MATKRPGRTVPPPSERQWLVLLEDIRAQNRAVIEVVRTESARLDRSIADLRAELVPRIEALEAAVRQNSRDIRKNSEDIRRLEAEVRSLKEAAQGYADRASFLALEVRVTALERRVATGP